MKHMTAILLCALLVTLAGCGGTKPAAPSSNPPASSSEVSSESSPELADPQAENAGSAVDGGAAASAQEKLMVADAALYRGVMQDLAVDDNGNTIWILAQVDGTDFGYPKLKATLTENTRYSFDTKEAGNGSYLEVYYGGKPDGNGVVEAIAVNLMDNPDLVIYNGVLKEVTPDPEKEGTGSLLLDDLSGDGMGYTFHYSPDTQFYLDFDSMKPGDKLNVYHSPAATRSIPPQSAAFEVRPYVQNVLDGEIPAAN